MYEFDYDYDSQCDRLYAYRQKLKALSKMFHFSIWFKRRDQERLGVWDTYTSFNCKRYAGASEKSVTAHREFDFQAIKLDGSYEFYYRDEETREFVKLPSCVEDLGTLPVCNRCTNQVACIAGNYQELTEESFIREAS